MLGWTLLITGSCICLVNLYLSILRYPLHRAAGRNRTSYRHVSVLPLVGSVAVVVAWTFWIRHQESLALDIAAWSIAILDTGGIHWFVASVTYHWLRDRGRASA